MTDLFLACERGCVEYVVRELELKKIKGRIEKFDNCLVVSQLSEADIVKAAYLLQTPLFIGRYLGTCKATLETESTLLELETLLGGLEYKDLFVKDETFHVSCHREGTHEYNSVDISQQAGRIMKRHCKEELSFAPVVDLKKPQNVFHAHIDQDKLWLAQDLLGKEPSKRPYKVFNNPHSMKGPVATCLVMASGWKPGEVLLDPFASGGVIAVETALFSSGTSIWFYDKNQLKSRNTKAAAIIKKLDTARKNPDAKEITAIDAQLRNISAAKKNAKIAGVDKMVSFSKMELEWIDTKFAGKSVHRIVCHPPQSSKHVALAKVKKIYQDLFYQASYVLKTGGSIAVLVYKPEELAAAAQQYGFEIRSQNMIHTGKQAMWIVVFVRT